MSYILAHTRHMLERGRRVGFFITGGFVFSWVNMCLGYTENTVVIDSFEDIRQ